MTCPLIENIGKYLNLPHKLVVEYYEDLMNSSHICILIDGARGESKSEQMTIILRFTVGVVHVDANINNNRIHIYILQLSPHSITS